MSFVAAAVGIGIAGVGLAGKSIARGKANRQLSQLQKQDPVYQRSKYPGMMLGMANNTLNSRVAGADQYGRNVMSSGQSAFNNASKYATDASQLLGANAGIQGQTDQQLGDLQLQEADWKKFGLGQLNDAYGAMANEDRVVFDDETRRFNNKVGIQGKQAENRQAGWQDLSNFGMGAASIGIAAQQGSGGSSSGGTGGSSGYWRSLQYPRTGGNVNQGASPASSFGQMPFRLPQFNTTSINPLAPPPTPNYQYNQPFYPSDIRLKENYFITGKSPSGINIYEFSYKGSSNRYSGVMAQEVPFASVEVDGYLSVDYSKIDVPFKQI